MVASNVAKISGFSPTSAITGATVTIDGNAFTGAGQVHFGSLAATFTVLSSTEIEATVPSGAVAGTISVTTATSKATSAAKFTPTLSVTGETPGRAAVGASITIKGAGFTPGSSVSFGSVASSNVTYVSATTIKAVVPSGAHTGLISVTNGSLPIGTVKSAGSFVVA